MPNPVLLSCGMAFGAMFVTVLIASLMPGRRGHMRTTREMAIPDTSLADAQRLMTARLRDEGFEIVDSRPAFLQAVRAQKYNAVNPLAAVDHAGSALGAEVNLREAGASIMVTVSLWMPSLVFYDTGEGRFIDLTLERLLLGDRATPPPIVPNRNLNAVMAVSCAVVMMLVALGLLLPQMDGATAQWLARAVMHTLVYPVVLAVLAWVAMLRKPDAITGGAWACAGVALAAMAAFLAVAIYAIRFGNGSMLWWLS